MKKLLSVLLAVILSSSVFVACGGNTTKNGGKDLSAGLNDADIWGAPATEKVLQNVTTGYDSFKTEAAINIIAARGEYEAQHIIITAEKDLVYNVEINSLKSVSAAEFKKENIDVFHEKYIEVKSNFENNGMPVGMYPDALVPFDAIKACGENTVKANENQGIYFRFNVGKDQQSGTYTGSFDLTIGKETKKIPVTLTILDVTVSEESHAKSIFLNQWHYQKGELDTSQAMMDKYTEALLEYRLNPDLIVTDTNHTDDDIAYYTERAYEFMQNPKCTNITIPYATKTIENQQCIDPDIFAKYLKSFAMKSFETGFNMLEKSICYIGIIDEPMHSNLLERVKVVSKYYRQTIEEVATDLEKDNSITAANKEEVIASLRKVRNVVTCCYDDSYAPYVDTWCPQYQYYDSESLRQYYDNQEERWFYGCISPRAPYPTYHMDDTLLSARALGWMMAEYDVVGNLYWATNIYASYDGSKYEDIEDYYGGSASRFPNVNGDGYLFYPGKQYGIDGPIGSLRLEAIRDGLEEYELIYAMKNTYSEISDQISEDNPSRAFNADKMIESLTGLIYSGTRVATTSKNFQTSRDALLELSVLSQSPAKFCVVDYVDNGYGSKTFKFYAADDVVVKNDGVAITDSVQVDGGKIYTLTLEMKNDKNSLNVSVEIGDSVYYYKQDLGGKVAVNLADNTSAEDFTKEGVTPAYSLVEASSVDASLTGKLIKLDIPQTAKNVSQSFRMAGSLLNGIDEKADKVIFHIYYDGEDNPKLTLSGKHKNQKILVDMSSVTLQKGMNTISVSLTSLSWDRLGEIEYIAFYLGAKNGEPARTIYIANTVIYGK